MRPSGLLFTFYGDDFTGSTDVLEALTAYGLPTALFLKPPTPETLARFRLINGGADRDGRLAAFGVAGISRTLSPAAMKTTLPPIFAGIAVHASRFFHYKICSTFDSAPTIGNIGMATDLALEAFPSRWVPLVVAAPALGRYCAFGNLFARGGGATYRLDRHPTMTRHPITPMDESDLRLHLARQTSRDVQLVDLLTLRSEAADAAVPRGVGAGGFVLFDTIDEDDLARVGAVICQHGQAQGQLLVGSSGVEHAVCRALRQRGELGEPVPLPQLPEVTHLIAVAGSLAPGTTVQIEWALARGFADVRLDATALSNPDCREAEIERTVAAAATAWGEGRSPLIYTTRILSGSAVGGGETGTAIAAAQGTILRRLLQRVGPQRVVVAGGDTSGHAARALGIHALEMAAPIAPGAPLCLAHSCEPALQGLQIALKGGQNGDERYFESVRMGRAV